MAKDNCTKPANQSVAKLFQMLECMAESRTLMKLQDISSQIRVPPPTALRYLNALIQDGYVVQDEDSLRYMLTWRVRGLGDRVRDNLGIRTMAGTLINDLSAALSLSACLVVEQDGKCIYLDCVDSPRAYNLALQHIGKQTPLHATGSGKILLTRYTPAELDRLIGEKGLEKLTERTITSKEALIKELETVRSRGYGLDDQECEPDLRCVSVPVYDYTGGIHAAISIFGSTQDVTDARIHGEILPALREAARKLSFRLGSGPLPGHDEAEDL
jgi:DNA-binding IclR family transcriptional regulator